MTPDTKRTAGILLIVLPTVMFGGVSILAMLTGVSNYIYENPWRLEFWRAGHAHAGVLLVLSLVALLYVDKANLSEAFKTYIKYSIPSAAIFIPAGFFLSVLDNTASKPNWLINLAYIGAVLLATGVITLGIGLIKKDKELTK